MSYKIVINTDSYVCGRCSKENWEVGTRNDYMLAINGRTFCEKNLREVRWLLDLFQGISNNSAEWSPENIEKVGKYGEYYGMSDRYYEWLHRKAHTVTYRDRLCGFDRTQYLSGYGVMQGYFDRDVVLDELKKNGTVRVPFRYLYDSRQYDKDMNGCYMEISNLCFKAKKDTVIVTEDIREIIEDVLDGFGVKYEFNKNDNGTWNGFVEFWTDTAGQDIFEDVDFDGDFKNFVKKFCEAAECYDVDEEVGMYINHLGQDGVPATARELVDDCQEAKDTLMNIAKNLENAIKKCA